MTQDKMNKMVSKIRVIAVLMLGLLFIGTHIAVGQEVATNAGGAKSVGIQVGFKGQRLDQVSYTTFEYNKPKTYGNQLFIWKATSSSVPWGEDPVYSEYIGYDRYIESQYMDFIF